MSFVGSVLQGIGAIGQGNSAKAQSLARQQELEREAQLQKTAATEQQADALYELNKTLGGIRALTATRGFDTTSPSAMAISDSIERDTRRNTQRIAFNANQQSANMILAGKVARQAGNAAQTAGYLSGFGSFFKAAGEAASKYG